MPAAPTYFSSHFFKARRFETAAAERAAASPVHGRGPRSKKAAAAARAPAAAVADAAAAEDGGEGEDWDPLLDAGGDGGEEVEAEDGGEARALRFKAKVVLQPFGVLGMRGLPGGGEARAGPDPAASAAAAATICVVDSASLRRVHQVCNPWRKYFATRIDTLPPHLFLLFSFRPFFSFFSRHY